MSLFRGHDIIHPIHEYFTGRSLHKHLISINCLKISRVEAAKGYTNFTNFTILYNFSVKLLKREKDTSIKYKGLKGQFCQAV